MSGVDIKEIVSQAGIDSVKKTTAELEKSVAAAQDFIVAAKTMNDVLAKSPNMSSLSKNVQAQEIAQEKLKQAMLKTQALELKLESDRAAAAAKEQDRQEKALAAEKKAIEADEKRIETLRRKANAQIESSEANNGATLAGGTTVTESQVDDALAASQAAAIPAIEANTEATEENAEAKRQLAFEALQAREAERQNAQELRRSVREANAARGSVEQRRLALARLQRTFDGLSEAERNSPFGQRLQRTIPQLNAQVLELERSTGRAQRNVGNYGNAFSRAAGQAWNGLKSIANILPGLGIAGLIGFAVEPIIEYVKELDFFKDKIEDIAAAGGAVSSEYKKAVSDVTALGSSLKEYQTGTISRTEVVKRFNETIGQTVGELQTAEQVENFYNSKAGAFVKATLLRAQAQAALNVATEKNSEALKRQIADPTFVDKFLGSISSFEALFSSAASNQGALDQRAKAAEKIRKDGEEAVVEYERLQKLANSFAKSNGINFRGKENQDDAKKAEAKARKAAAARIQIQIDENQRIAEYYKEQVENQNFSQETRLNSLNNYNKTLNDIATLEFEKEKAANKLSNDEKLKAENDLVNKRLDIVKKSGEKTTEIAKQTREEAEKIRVIQNERAIQNIENERDKELSILLSSYQKRGDFSKKAQEDLEKKRLEIIRKYNLMEVNEAIRQAQILLAVQKSLGFDTTKQQADLSALILRAKSLEVEGANSLSDKELDKRKQNAESIKEVAQAVFDFTRSLANGIFEANISNLEAESKARDEKKDRDIEAIQESTLSEEEKAEKIAVINSQAEANQKQIDLRIAEQKRKQAIADKAFALTQIAINTAVAVSKALAQTGVLGAFVIPGIIALGAIQAAAVLAQPLPKFEKGGIMQKDGFAEYGHGIETRIDPDGKVSLTSDTPEIGWVQKGTRFISAAETKQRFAKPDKFDSAGKSWDVEKLIQESKRSSAELKKTVSNMKTPTTLITKSGIRKQNIENSRLQKYFKNNL